MSTNTKLPYWIQRADFSSDDFEPVSFATACHVLKSYPWLDELARQDALTESGKDECPPGIGFHRPNSATLELLHLCPENADTWMVNFHYPKTVRTLGIWQRQVERNEHAYNVPVPIVEELLANFFRNRHDEVPKLMKSVT